MIPVRVSLSNFLTYSTTSDGGPVIFDFDGSRLWSISGDNGAGKTTVFDAVTYALFGEHRGGRQHDRRLVRKGTTDMEVSFEFRHSGRLWRVRRTLSLSRRRNGTIQEHKAAEVAERNETEAVWVPVPGADSPRQVEAWVAAILRMRSDLFKSTVLLEQGGADRILMVEPATRFNIFASLIDLDVYRRLEDAAEARRRNASAIAKSMAVQLESMPEVSDQDLATARECVKTADAELEGADNCAAEAATALTGAWRFADLQAEAEALKATIERLDQLLAHAEAIRADAARAAELNTLIPALEDAGHFLDKATAAEAAAAAARRQLDEIDLSVLAGDVEEAARAAEAANADVEALEVTDQEFRTWQPQLQGRHAARRAVARQRQAVDDAGDLAHIAAEVDGLVERRDAVLSDITALESQQEFLREEAADYRAQAEQLAGVITERQGAADEATCSRCGQPIDAKHLARELEELANAESEARAKAAEANGLRDAVTPALTAARDLERDFVRQVAAAQHRAESAAKAADDLAAAIRELDSLLAHELPATWAAADGDDDSAKAAVAALDERAQRLPAELRVARSTATDARKKHEAAQRLVHETEMRATRLAGEVQRHAETAKGARAATAARLSGVNDELRATFAERRGDLLAELRAEAQTLEGAADRLTALTDAEREQHTARTRARTVAEEQEAIPPEHRLTVEDAQTALDEAKAAVLAATDARDHARDVLRRLDDDMERRKELIDQHTNATRSSALAGRLERLLGRAGLQGALLGQAIGGVEDLANETLSRLSRGTLSISLNMDDTSETRKLEILVTDAASADEPLEAAFVSGSQRFRVAVALAAGLGQYVGGPDAVRALIIDEGFGSLDEAGREEMIAELHNLANHLERVIVVSHHTDFSDPARFPQAFHLRKVGRHTELTRVI